MSYNEIEQAIEAYVEEYRETTAGMSVAVYDENGVIYQNAFGYADKENGLAVDEDIGAYMPQGFLTNLTYDKKITMLDLMNHQADFQEMYLGVQTVYEEEAVSLEEALRKNQPKQVYEPGTVTAYSNWGAALAAYVVQKWIL